MALSPLGLCAPVPDGFTPTYNSYRSWLIDEIECLECDVDLIGHDWVALHVFGVLAERPELVRSWAADVAGILHPQYQWHDIAQAWQTPGVGEQAIKEMFGLPAHDTEALLMQFDIPLEQARTLGPTMTETMGECVLGLYRSATQPRMSQLGQSLMGAEKRPGLVFLPTQDPFTGTPQMCESVAKSLAAKLCRLEGLGHWWMYAGAAEAAQALISHWRNVGS